MMQSIMKLILAAALYSSVSAATTATGDVLVTMPITVDGNMQDLKLLRGETAEDAARSFARSHGLLNQDDDAKVQQVIDQLSSLLRDQMSQMQQEEPAESSETLPPVEITLPVTVEGYSGELKKYQGETSEAAVERYLYATGFSMDVMRRVYPQLLTALNDRLQQQAPRQEVFSFPVSIDGKEVVFQHFDNGDPTQEAISTLQAAGYQDQAQLDRMAPQVAQEITNRINAQQQLVEAFQMPVTLGGQQLSLSHYEGLSAQDSARHFLSTNNIQDEATVQELVPQLVQIIENRATELQQQATQQATQPQRSPSVILPISLGNDQQAILEYYDGDNIQTTVISFLNGVGMTAEDPAFQGNAERLVGMVQERLNTAQAKDTTPRTPLLSLPITLSGVTYELQYYEGQEPGAVAHTFCNEKYNALARELATAFDGNQVAECSNVIQNTITQRLSGNQQSGEPTSEAPKKGDLLFTVDINFGEGNTVPMEVHRNERPEDIAKAFCKQHNVDESNIPVLVQAIEKQLQAN